MAKKNQKCKRDAEWAKAKRLCRLSAEDVRMAKELGFKPRGLMKNIPSKSEPWKAPVRIWIRDLYEKRRKKAAKRQSREIEHNSRPNVSGGRAGPDAPQPRPLLPQWDTVLEEEYWVDAGTGVVVPVESEEFAAWVEAEEGREPPF